ncbi:hypothetical protein CQZ94_28680 [Bacillus sp. MYb209]|nr:hypothetical protein CQZ94_28680 [Bacillus sp. MYb209]
MWISVQILFREKSLIKNHLEFFDRNVATSFNTSRLYYKHRIFFQSIVTLFQTHIFNGYKVDLSDLPLYNEEFF